MKITLNLNGKTRNFDILPGQRAKDLLLKEGLISIRDGCNGEGSCGACTIVLNGKTVNSCLLLAAQLNGKEINTVEYLSKGRDLSPIQESFLDAGVVQCGYCTPAMLLATKTLLDSHPEPTKEQVKDAFSGIFCRCTGYEQFYTAVGLASSRITGKVYDKELSPEFCDDLRLVGKSARKIDGVKLVKGHKAFVEDMVQPGSLHLKMLRSPFAHAYIKNIDTSEAEAMEGVELVVTHKNCPDVYYNQAGQGFPEPSPYDRKMFGEKVRHVGDRVAAVVASSEALAMEAIKRIKVEYEPLRPVLTVEDAAAEGAPLIHNSFAEYVVGAPDNLDNSKADPRDGKIIYQFPIHGNHLKNIAARVSGGIGDIESGFKEADVIIEREYEATQVQCTPLEPHIVYTRMEGERLIIHAATQVPWHVRRIVARVLGISENKIRVIKERLGGGFGAKQDIVLEEIASYCTWETGKPVIFRYTREEEFIESRTRHPMKIKIKLGAKNDGTFTAIEMVVRANTGPYGSHCLTVPMNACSKALPLFLCEKVHFDVTTYYSNIPPTGAYQGYGAPQGSFALQMACAELAEKLGMDHLALLEKNRVDDGTMLEILKCLGEGREGTPQAVSSCGLGEAITKGAEMIEWGKKEESSDPDVKIGKGVAIIQQASGLPGLDSSNSTISLLGDGSFMLLSGGADLGTGLDTLMAKVAAEVLCTNIEDISVLSGDTDITPYDDGAYASSGTFFSGGAALKAAQAIKERILEVASEILNEPVEDIKLEYPSKVVGKTKTITYYDVSRYTQSGTGSGQISVTRCFTTDKAAFPYGAHFCQVAVNQRTGKVIIQKYYALQDSGTPINPELALGQIFGGALKTIGHSMFEEMILDENGVCINPTLRDYRVPMIGDLPEDFRAELIYTNDPFGPYGGKSIGEISCNGAAPAIASAIHDAVGIWLRSWHFSPEKILKELGKL